MILLSTMIYNPAPFARIPSKLIDRKVLRRWIFPQISNESRRRWRPALTLASTNWTCVGRWKLPMGLGNVASVVTGADHKMVVRMTPAGAKRKST